jgi:hypothetical protein
MPAPDRFPAALILATATLLPHGAAAETVTPQPVYFRLQNDYELVAEPCRGGAEKLGPPYFRQSFDPRISRA